VVGFADMYCGGGLGARGAAAAGCRPLLAFDSWDTAVSTYRANFPRAEVIGSCATRIDPLRYIRPEEVDLLISSPECTNHSIARGNRAVDESSQDTALLTLDWVKRLKPRWIVIENVTRIRKWPRYRRLIDTLGDLGYGVRETVLCSSVFGVPQSRRRLFVTAQLDSEPPKINTSPLTRRVASDILDPRDQWPMSPLNSPGRAQSTIERAERAVSSLGNRAPFLLVYYGSDKAGGWQSLDVPLRTVTTLDRFALVEWRRGRQFMRMLQPGELARAMGVPVGHLFPAGTRRDKVKLCGNGICPPVMRRVICSLIPPRFRFR
jgi:DNA (cytosine-5)-methyltransferase 1